MTYDGVVTNISLRGGNACSVARTYNVIVVLQTILLNDGILRTE